MFDTTPFCTPDACALLPSLVFGAVVCPAGCDRTHGYYLEAHFLFWGLNAVWIGDGEFEEDDAPERPAPTHPIGMTPARWQAVMDGLDLTPGEVGDGWHFCSSYDGLLVGPGMAEAAYCKCGGGDLDE